VIINTQRETVLNQPVNANANLNILEKHANTVQKVTQIGHCVQHAFVTILEVLEALAIHHVDVSLVI